MRVHFGSRAPGNSNRDLERQVLDYLGFLSYPAFLLGIQVLLRSIGLRDVVMVRRSPRGASRFGGYDLRAVSVTGGHRTSVLIQAKMKARVQRRFVDELRGTMLRLGAPSGMIISTDRFSLKARDAALLYPGRPVRLIDGPLLARMMVENGVGVRVKPLTRGTLPELVLDELFFDRLEELASKDR